MGTSMKSWFLVLLVIVSSSLQFGDCIVGGGEAPKPPVDDPVVYVAKDDREARVFGTKDQKSGYYLFRGIRYSEPPVGMRRFQRSYPMYLDGDINATQWGAPCVQPDQYGAIIGSEDCLFLNVFTPALPDATDGYPVLIWIHGGGFRVGAATQYEMRQLIEKKTIVVSIQYRLGSLGFLCNGDKDLSGNNGLFDMTVATEWVRNYIEFFGGNPNRIVAFGQGTGASAAFLLGLSQHGRSSFSGIVAMSGSPVSRFAIDDDPLNTTLAVAAGNNCPTDDSLKMVQCLREVPAAKIIEHDSKHESITGQPRNFVTDLSGLVSAGPVNEGKNDNRSLPNFVDRAPEESLNSDDIPDIPLLTGVVQDETGAAVHGPLKGEISQKLQAIPDFFAKVLVPDLQKIVPSIGTVVNQFVPEAFTKYFNPFGNNGGQKIDSIAKVSEALNDAIFNAPAFLTVKNWSKKSKAFLYSFDHKSKQGFGRDFLGGLPIIGDSAAMGRTSHGDDLGYVFEPNTIYGKAMPEKNLDQEDLQVREVFTDMIAEFARSGNVTMNSPSGNNGNSLPFFMQPFGSGNNKDGFLSITSKPKISNKFRFCEMGLWTGSLDRFKSPDCKSIFVDIANPLKTFQKVVGNVPFIPTLPTFPLPGNGSLPQLPTIPGVPGVPRIPGIPGVPNLPNPLPNGKSSTSKPSMMPPIGNALPTIRNPLRNPVQTGRLPGIPGFG